MKKDFIKDFDDAWKRIESNEPFAHARYADGEICLMKGIPIGRGSQASDIDNWTASPALGLTRLGVDLFKSLSHTDENYYYAISCDTSSSADKNWLLEHIKQDRKYITFANLWINGNYNRFIEKVKTLKKPIHVIGNINGEDKKYPFQLKSYMTVGNECVNVWQLLYEEIEKVLKDAYENVEGETFFISAGPMSEVIISYLWKLNPRNQYIDVGSAIDEFVHGKKTRPYMIPGTFYNKQICEMEL